MAIDTARGVQGNTGVDPAATPIDAERRRERREPRGRRTPPAAAPAAPAAEDDDADTIAPAGAKIDVRA